MSGASPLLDDVVRTLEDGKAEDIQVIDVRKRCDFTDYMVIVSSASGRKTRALAAKAEKVIKSTTRASAWVEGLSAGNWVVLDAGDVIVHIFRPEVRAFYKLEKLWTSPPQEEAEHRHVR